MSPTPSTRHDLPRTVLLMGGSGFLGSNLGQALMDRDCTVLVLDRVAPKWDAEVYRGRGHFIRASASDMDAVARALDAHPVEAVLHLASSLLPASSLEDVCSDLAEHLAPGLRLFDLLLSRGIHRFAFLSSGGTVYGTGGPMHQESDPLRPLNYYGWMKVAFEEFIRLRARTTPLQHLILRPSNPYGRYQDLRGRQGLVSVVLGRILDRLPLEIWGDGSTVRDYLYIDDFCQAILSLMEQPVWNGTFNIGSGLGTSVNEIIHRAQEVTGAPLEVIYRPSRAVDAPSVVLDVSRLRTLHPAPFLDLRAGMSHYWEEIQRRPAQ